MQATKKKILCTWKRKNIISINCGRISLQPKVISKRFMRCGNHWSDPKKKKTTIVHAFYCLRYMWKAIYAHICRQTCGCKGWTMWTDLLAGGIVEHHTFVFYCANWTREQAFTRFFSKPFFTAGQPLTRQLVWSCEPNNGRAKG